MIPLTVIFLLLAIGLGFLVAAIANKAPLWIAVLFLFIVELLRVIPKG